MVRAFLGMGLLGMNFVKALLDKRSRKYRCGTGAPRWQRALEADGAKAFAAAADAVRGADQYAYCREG